VVKIIHTSDVHIGKAFVQFGEFGRDLRRHIKETFRRVCELAASERADALLLAGDIFDSENISSSDLRFFADTVQSISPVPAFYLPGTWTHDSWRQKTIYRSQYFGERKPGNLIVFGGEQVETFKTAGGRVAVHGRAVLPNCSNPLEGFHADRGAEYNIAVLHAGVALPQIPDTPGSCLLRREHVEACDFDYLAMGEWHKFARYFEGCRTTVLYPGSPETLSFDTADGSGYLAVVTLGPNPPSVEKKRVGYFTWREVDLSWEQCGSPEGLERKVTELADPRLVLRVRLRGTSSDQRMPDWEELRTRLEPQFADLSLDLSQLRPEVPLEKLEREYREGSVERAFVETVKKAIGDSSNAEEKERLSEVLRRGYGLFEGEDVSS
jgi:DNA repair exonuclease SbcCD nuclease subunit